MPDTSTLTPPAPTAQPANAAPKPERRPRGYFNQAQLEDLVLAEDVLAAALNPSRSAALAGRQIGADYVAGLATAIGRARDKTSDTGQAGDVSAAATLNATGSERALLVALQGIQSAAKQKKRMLEEAGDATTTFTTDGYLIGARLNPSHAVLLQGAETLIKKAKSDALPGYDAAGIKAVEDAVKDYKEAAGGQDDAEEGAGTDRLQRDRLIAKINSRRIAIQHAADALWPYTNPDNRPVRRTFKLPLARPCNG